MLTPNLDMARIVDTVIHRIPTKTTLVKLKGAEGWEIRCGSRRFPGDSPLDALGFMLVELQLDSEKLHQIRAALR